MTGKTSFDLEGVNPRRDHVVAFVSRSKVLWLRIAPLGFLDCLWFRYASANLSWLRHAFASLLERLWRPLALTTSLLVSFVKVYY